MNPTQFSQSFTKAPRILHIMRTISVGSTPWNDLYRYSRRIKPGTCFPPIQPKLTLRTISIRKAACGSHDRVFLEANPLGVLLLVRRFQRRSRSRGNELLLHSHAPTLFWVALFVHLLFRDVILVTNLHNEWPDMRWYQRFGLSVMSHISRKLICVSNAIQRNIPPRIRCALIARDALEAIQNGIPSDEMDRSHPVSDFPRTRAPDVVVVARMVPQKNFEQILSVFMALRHARNLIWYGDGPLRKEIESHAEALGLREQLVLKGRRPRHEVIESLKSSAVYLSCSRWEGIGVANIEAAGMGAQVFLSDIPPHQEIAQALGISTYPLGDVKPWASDIDAVLKEASRETAVLGSERRACAARCAFDLATKTEEYFGVYAAAARV